MKSRLVIAVIAIGLLALLVGIFPFFTASSQVKAKNANTEQSSTLKEQTKNSQKSLSHKVKVYYFHGNFRCKTCRKIEAYTKEAIDGAFADQLKDGRLEWRVINVDKPENKHFTKDYQIYTKSVVITDNRDGKQIKWKNLNKIWEVIYNKKAFVSYVRDEISSYLGEG